MRLYTLYPTTEMDQGFDFEDPFEGVIPSLEETAQRQGIPCCWSAQEYRATSSTITSAPQGLSYLSMNWPLLKNISCGPHQEQSAASGTTTSALHDGALLPIEDANARKRSAGSDTTITTSAIPSLEEAARLHNILCEQSNPILDKFSYGPYRNWISKQMKGGAPWKQCVSCVTIYGSGKDGCDGPGYSQEGTSKG